MSLKTKIYISLITITLLILCVLTCFTKQDGVFRLDNGLEIVYREIPNSHVATILIAVNAGSILETDETRGIAYVTSQCLFQESEHYKDIQKYIDSFGVKYKSEVIPDFCRYSFTFGEPYLDSVVTMITDVLINPHIDKELFAETKKRLQLNTLHRQEKPQVFLKKYFLKTAFQVHPYRFYPEPNIENINKFNQSDIIQFIDQVYTPSNIKIIVTGPKKSKRAIKQLRSQLELWEKNPISQFNWQAEPDQMEPRNIKAYHNFDFDFAFVAVGWKAPSILSQDTYTMDIILAALGIGESSRLNKQIRNKMSSVYYIWAEYLTPREPGYFVVYAICDPDDAQKVQDRIMKEIDILKNDSITPSERERANSLLRTREAFNWEHTEDTAQYIGYWTIMKDYSFALTYIDNLNAVTTEEVKYVSQKYFDNNNSTSIILLPQTRGGKL